jgi:hypothetical protein
MKAGLAIKNDVTYQTEKFKEVIGKAWERVDKAPHTHIQG